MTATRDLINMTLRVTGVIGVGQDALAQDSNDAFSMLNWMLAQWSKRRWLVYHLVDVSKAATGATSYTVGTGMDFNTPRPDRIEKAWFVQTNITGNQISYPLQIIEAYEDYANISLKSLVSFPSYAFYDPGYPTGTLYAWPIPSNIYTVHILVKSQLSAIANLSDDINLPPEYEAAIIWNLAEWIRPAYQLPPDPQVTMMAKNTRNTLYKANTQIPRLSMPPTLVKNGRYNIYSDRVT